MIGDYQPSENRATNLREAVGYFEMALHNLARLRAYNLHHTEEMSPSASPVTAEDIQYRKPDGSYNDVQYPLMGTKGARFGRNFPLSHVGPEDPSTILEPNPLVVSEKLLARKEFIPATSVNMLAAAWVQFQVHDWFGHKFDEDGPRWEIQHPDPNVRPLSVMRNEVDPPRLSDRGKPPAYVNTQVHWWDASQIYGSDPQTAKKIRTHKRGKLKTVTHGVNELLPVGKNGIDDTGVTDNWWLGLSLFHTLFTLEHNQICDALYAHYGASDEELFQWARLINTALMAKIHTIEWTPAMLDDPRVIPGLRSDWWGVSEKSDKVELIETLHRTENQENLPPHRLYGTSRDHFGSIYAMTEEFVAVYRMHALLPDKFEFKSISGSRPRPSAVDFIEVTGEKVRQHMENKSTADLFYSFGVSYPGALKLHNYPDFLRNLSKEEGDKENIIDLAAVDILRDRERGIPRYNQFRVMLGLTPCSDYLELTNGDEKLAHDIKCVYGEGNIDRVDLMVGLFAEHCPKGFAFSRTALQVFTVMAPQRLKSDRFFTTDYTPQVYTPAGMAWIENNTLAIILKRNLPKLADVLVEPAEEGSAQTNPFKPEAWKQPK